MTGKERQVSPSNFLAEAAQTTKREQAKKRLREIGANLPSTLTFLEERRQENEAEK